MDKNTFIAIWGSAAGLARAIGENETTVRAWLGRGSIPARYDARIIEAARLAGCAEFGPSHLFEVRQSIASQDAA